MTLAAPDPREGLGARGAVPRRQAGADAPVVRLNVTVTRTSPVAFAVRRRGSRGKPPLTGVSPAGWRVGRRR
jgi:hypothetical protein